MSLADIWEASVRARPGKVALRFAGRAWTYRELCDRVDRLAGVLSELGVSAGGHVAAITPNHPACMELLLACMQVGAVYEPYNIRLSPLTIKQLLARSGASVVFLAPELRESVGSVLGDVGHPVRLVLLGDEAVGDALAYEQLLAHAGPRKSRAAVEGSDTALLLYTSGTTGIPRGVMLSHDALLKRVEIDTRAMQFSDGCVTLCVLPLFHVTFMSSLITLLVGGELVMASSRKAEDLVASISEYGVTHLCVVPFLLRGIAAYVEREDVRITSLRLVVYGGEPVNAELLALCQKLFACGFFQGYGMTETFGAIAMLLPEHHRDPARLLSAGTVVPGMDLKIIDDGGAACPRGVAGEVVVKTPTIMTGYLRDEERTREVLRDGWYFTGDIATLDDEGFLTLVDRKSNMVITGGENVYPLEVERCIRSLGEEVLDVAVVGVPDAYWGESLAAFVVRAEDSQLTAEDVMGQCARQLGGYKKPHRIAFVQELERSASGKVSKAYIDLLKQQEQ